MHQLLIQSFHKHTVFSLLYARSRVGIQRLTRSFQSKEPVKKDRNHQSRGLRVLGRRPGCPIQSEKLQPEGHVGGDWAKGEGTNGDEGKNTPGRGNSMCNGPDAQSSLVVKKLGAGR